jgi:hypothetical protein
MKKIALLFITPFLIHCGSAGEDRSFGVPDDNGGNDNNLITATPTSTPTSTITNSPTQTPTPSNISTAKISSFIWKPESERDGNLVVLVNPIRVRVEVTGDISETLVDFGPSNGKGTTARARNTGCDFGRNIIVEFFDSLGRRILTERDKESLLIPDGCKREEF